SLLCDEWERTGRISLRRFYGRRARRLLPALVMVVAAFAVVMVALHPFPNVWPVGRLIVSTLLFANNWVTAFGHQHALGPLAPTWLGSRWTGRACLGGLALLLFADPELTRRWVYLGAALLTAPLIVCVLLREDGALARALSARALCYTGRISYGLYLCHLPIH